MNPVTRRKFIQTSSVAAVGAALAGPAVLAAANNRSDQQLRGTSSTAAVRPEGGADVPGDGSVVAHVVDAASGHISLFVGTREVVVRDRELASRLLAAAR